MNIKNLLMPNNAQNYLTSCLNNYCAQKTPIIITLFEQQSQPCGLLYKMLKQNNLLDCIVVPCKNNFEEVKRFEKVIRRNFNNSFILIVRGCDCIESNFGDVCLNYSQLNFINNKSIQGVGDACLTVCDNINFKAPCKPTNIQKIQTISIISAVYNIICGAFKGILEQNI